MNAVEVIFEQPAHEAMTVTKGYIYYEDDGGLAEMQDVDATFVAEVPEDQGLSLLDLARTALAEDWESEADSVFDSLLEDARL